MTNHNIFSPQLISQYFTAIAAALGTLDDVPFDGGQAEGFSFVLGEGRMLPEFEAAALGTRVGDEKTFDLKFPDDYHGKEVAGKTVQFKIKVHAVDAAQLPAIDTAFAQSLGVADGEIGRALV